MGQRGSGWEHLSTELLGTVENGSREAVARLVKVRNVATGDELELVAVSDVRDGREIGKVALSVRTWQALAALLHWTGAAASRG